jgi:hypothetical protein
VSSEEERDALLARVQQRAVQTNARLDAAEVDALVDWGRQVLVVLATVRANMDLLRTRAEAGLTALRWEESATVGKGRHATVIRSSHPSAGWKLYSWNARDRAYREAYRALLVLDIDGRFVVTRDDHWGSTILDIIDRLSDREFLELLRSENNGTYPATRVIGEALARLLQPTGAPCPPIPPHPLDLDHSTLWERACAQLPWPVST